MDNLTENFISSLSVPFVRAHCEELSLLNENAISDYQGLISALKGHHCSDELTEAVLWHVACKKTCFTGLPYTGVIKKYRTGIAKELVRYINYQFKMNGISGQNATIHNLDGYIPFLTEGKFASLSSDMGIPQPTTIDIWGSCISREIFTFLDANATLVNYTYRSSPLHIGEPPVESVEPLFDNIDLFNGSQWRTNFVKNNLMRQTTKVLQESNAEWLMLDLYDICELTYKIGDAYFVLDYDSTKLPIYSVLCDKHGCQSVGFFPYQEDTLIQRLTTFADFVKNKYGKRIILTNITFHNTFIGDDGIVRSLKRSPAEIFDKNVYLRKCQDFLRRYLDCYVLDFSERFLSDERFIWGESPVHYETSFFRFAADCVRKIIEGKCTEKHFSYVPIAYRIERISRIKNNNSFSKKESYALAINPLDRFLLPLDEKIVTENATYLDSIMQKLPPNADATDFISFIDDERSELKQECKLQLL